MTGEPLTKLGKTALCIAVGWSLLGATVPAAWAGEHSTGKADESPQQGAAPQANTSIATTPAPTPDLTARKRVGKASFYAKQFSGKTMADGEPMDPQGANAASRTLPLGTTAKVTNVETGKAAVVTIEDRGPYVDGRLVDLSPGTAAKIGLTPKKGVTKVVVAPISVPLPHGGVKTGAAAHEPEDKPDTLPLKDSKHDKLDAKSTELASASTGGSRHEK